MLIVDDEDLFAESIKALVALDKQIEVVGRGRNGREGVQLAKRLAPSVIVMDIGMPLLDGIDATREIRKSDPAVGVVIFTGSDEARDEQRAREVGADAYVHKTHIDAILLAAIHRAAAANPMSEKAEKAGRRAQHLEAAAALA